MIILPRQARDKTPGKHSKKKEYALFAGYFYMNLQPLGITFPFMGRVEHEVREKR